MRKDREEFVEDGFFFRLTRKGRVYKLRGVVTQRQGCEDGWITAEEATRTRFLHLLGKILRCYEAMSTWKGGPAILLIR